MLPSTHHIGTAQWAPITGIGAAQWAPIPLGLPSKRPSHWCYPVSTHYIGAAIVGTHHSGATQIVLAQLILTLGTYHISAPAQWALITLMLPSGHPSH